MSSEIIVNDLITLLSYDNNTNEVLSHISDCIQVLTHKPRIGDVRIKYVVHSML